MPPASSFEEAFVTLSTTLNEVEDEMTSIPHNPANWQSDGRMYPPQKDSIRAVPDYPHVVRLRTKGHNIFIAENGSIEVRQVRSGAVLFSKPGLDGKGVWK